MVALLLVALFQSAAPASAAAPSPPPAKTERLCRKQTVVGSTIKKKICPRKFVEEVAREDKADPTQVAQAAPK